MEKQEITQRYLGGIKRKTKEERIRFLEKKTNKFNEGIASSLTITLKNGTPIGFLGVKIDEANNKAELSYIFDYEYCKKGYCTETCEKLLDIGFNILNLNKIYADTIDGNDDSKRVLEKLDFKLEGVRRQAVLIDSTNEYKDFLDYGILRSEYNNNK